MGGWIGERRTDPSFQVALDGQEGGDGAQVGFPGGLGLLVGTPVDRKGGGRPRSERLVGGWVGG